MPESPDFVSLDPNRFHTMDFPSSDLHLWNRFREGDSQAFGSIYRMHIAELLSYGYRITSNRQLIKDSIHDLFLHIWLHREKLSETDSIKYYLFRSLRNRIVRTSTDPSPYEQGFRIDELLADASREQELIEQETRSGQLSQLKQAIDRLPKRQQEAIQLRYFHSFSLEEISSVMQMNNQSVRNLLHRAIVHLRNHFEIAGGLILSLIKIFG